MRLNLDVVPFSELTQSTLNAVLIYSHANRGTLLDIVQGTVSTTHSLRMVNDNNHAHTSISCDVPMHMKCNYVISCLYHVTQIYNECYMDNSTHALHPCIIWIIISINIQFPNKSHKSCQHIHTHIHTLHMSIHYDTQIDIQSITTKHCIQTQVMITSSSRPIVA